MTRPRGRPRQYDPQAALGAALKEFWSKGFSATSLDDLTAATKMNRPSLYRAFGDKEALYRKTLALVVGQMQSALATLVMNEPDLKKGLCAFFFSALDVYFSMEPAPGCPLVCTAPVEALSSPAVKEDLRAVITGVDELLTRRLRQAQKEGQFPESGDPGAGARMIQAVLHSLAIRARAGESKASLRRMARGAADLLCAR